MSVIRWLFHCQNPFKLVGYLPTWIWLYLGIGFFAQFIPAEWMGNKRMYGMVPLTDVLACLPKAFFIAAAIAIVWHWDIVHRIIQKVTLK